MSKQTDKSDVYNKGEAPKDEHRHILACVVDNEFGVLARVIGLFSGRGYNIESLTVAEVDEEKSLSRITVVTTGSDMVVEQIKALLERLIPVHKVVDITVQGPHIERELVLVKVTYNDEHHVEILDIANKYSARIMDTDDSVIIIAMTDIPSRIDDFLDLLRPYGIIENSRTGSTAISRGKKGIEA